MIGLAYFLIYAGVVLILAALFDRWRDSRKAPKDRIESIMGGHCE